MWYRARHLVLNHAITFVIYTFIALWALWVFDAALDGNVVATFARSAAGFAVVATCAATVVAYWPTKRRPTRLYHVTTNAVVDAATVEVHDDGTRTVALRGKRAGRPVYFFDRWPRRGSVEYNVKTLPDACIELVDVDHDDIVVRRRWTGAYHLSGLVHARARIHPLPWDFDRRQRNKHRRPRPSAPQ